VPSKHSLEEHVNHIRQVSDRLRAGNLKIKLRKCEFMKNRIEYLSHVIQDGVVSPGLKKIEALLNFKQPTNVPELQSFLGLAGYYRKFIKQFANMAGPLTELTK
jgi:hypothetical protein